MPEQSDFPDIWQCTSEHKNAVVEVRVPERETTFESGVGPVEEVTGYTWIEIPTTSVELWETKGGAAAIQRTAKVRFPTEWGRDTADIQHNSPRRLIERFEPTDAQPFMHARISFRSDDEEPWFFKHYGWVGGVGAASDDGLSKFWVYDFAEFLSGVPIGETFNHPSVSQASEIIARLTNDNTPIPVSEVVIMDPGTSEEYATQVEQFFEDDLVAARLGIFEAVLTGSAQPTTSSDPLLMGEDALQAAIADGSFEGVAIDTGANLPVLGVDNKSFTSNHDTLLDVYEWFEQKTGAKFRFDVAPNGDSVVLIADIVPTRRTFAADAVLESEFESDGDYQFHDDVSVLSNDALYEMKPFNTIHLRGSYPSGLVDGIWDGFSSAISIAPFQGGPPPEKYPVVKAQLPALVEAANDTEVSGEIIESDATSLEDAVQEAIDELRRRTEEQSEGEIIIRGAPLIRPYDRLDAFEVCNGYVQYEQQYVTYEVEEAKHEATADDAYTSDLRVSIWANEGDIEIVRDEMVEVDR